MMSCSECKHFFDSKYEIDGDATGECRFNPPVIVPALIDSAEEEIDVRIYRATWYPIVGGSSVACSKNEPV